ncbi:alpha/beta hydrolase [Candidatus Beckwithbacteria bacterium]|nr:alpha/beta hydrolase [Candidatus Beckwithbacteria bacterium]
MKNAIVIHGTGCDSKSYWIPSIKKFLEKRSYEVWTPNLPDSDIPDLKKWLPLVLNKGKFNKNTVLIGHSAGSPFILSVLENINITIHKAILVAGYYKVKSNEDNPLILQKIYNWTKIRKNVKDIIFINSNNDPWGCDDKQGLGLFKKLGGTLIIRESEGHMGSDSFKQPYKRFLLLEKLLELKDSRSSIDGSDKKD